ncbi:general stress protein [Porphyromonadaceae bacterium COT-184 OH4590]|nr:general stress protein [Porphyromonadaceae bacterium COT-184 OH4590]
MKNILIISGHPNLAQSHANKAILEEVKHLLPSVEISRLDTLYPDFKIDVEAEQAKLAKADIIVWQFPVNWYSIPALMKKWLDDVFTFGFAYGTDDTKLRGKKLILSFTTASPEEAYQYGGAQNYPITDFLNAFRQTANLCGMEFQEHIVSHSMMYMEGIMPAEVLTTVQDKAKAHAKRLVNIIA